MLSMTRANSSGLCRKARDKTRVSCSAIELSEVLRILSRILDT